MCTKRQSVRWQGATSGGRFDLPSTLATNEYIGTFSLGAAIGESTGDCARDAFSTARRGLADDLQAVRRGHAASPRAEARQGEHELRRCVRGAARARAQQRDARVRARVNDG